MGQILNPILLFHEINALTAMLQGLGIPAKVGPPALAQFAPSNASRMGGGI